MKFEFILSNTKKQKEMLNANDRPHWTQRQRITSYLRHIAKLSGQEGKCIPYTNKRPCGLIVTIYSPTKRRLDPPNLNPTIKALVDGLTDAGVWVDDNHEVIKETLFRYGGLSDIKGKYKIVLETVEGGILQNLDQKELSYEF
ncbi:hypothetical protein [Streptococcus sp. zg-JUN1979]|uniref:hypothetical protein n=1 Tax=Streptococcus sp. zg-JUN1979 TaxID=3391450 RepID=UPI0039A66683